MQENWDWNTDPWLATGRGWTLDSYYEARDEGFTNEEIAAYLSAKSSGKL